MLKIILRLEKFNILLFKKLLKKYDLPNAPTGLVGLGGSKKKLPGIFFRLEQDFNKNRTFNTGCSTGVQIQVQPLL